MKDGVVEFEQTPRGFVFRSGHPLLGEIHADFDSVGIGERQGTARSLLVGAALNCICGTLSAAMLARDVQYAGIKASGRAVKETVDGVSMVTRVELDIMVDPGDADREEVGHCLSIVKGCMITRSLFRGMEVALNTSML
ncbi:MAG: hypothetical protein MJ061_01755 [Mailhella sp.]|nr:hypothetical protein [Mailhella sp.]